jgi:hypothetical protein
MASINWSHPQALNLIGCWQLDDGTGTTATDLTGLYGNGTLGGTTGTPSWGTDPTHGGYLQFTAANGHYVQVPHNSAPAVSLANGKFSFQVKFRLNVLRNFDGLFTKTTGATYLPFDNWSQSGLIRVFYSDTSQNVVNVVATTWYDLIFAQNALVGAKAWLDGVLKMDVGTTLSLAPDTGAIRIGNRGDGVTAMDGRIAYCRLWNRTLDATDVAALTADPNCFLTAAPAGGLLLHPGIEAMRPLMAGGIHA